MAAPPAKKLRGLGRVRAGVTLSPEELEYVDTSVKGVRWWRCKKCTEMKAAAGGDRSITDEVAKRSADTHLLQHGLTEDTFKDWILIKDKARIKRQTNHLCELECAIGVTVQGDDSDGDEQDELMRLTSDGFKWVAHQVLVKCFNDGTPVQPLEYGGIDTGSLPPAASNASGHVAGGAQSGGVAAAIASLPVCDSSSGAASAYQIATADLWAGTALASQPASSSQVAIADPTAGHFGAVVPLVKEMHSIMLRKQDAENWALHMPGVEVKHSMLTMQGPLKKGEGNVLRAEFPVQARNLPAVPAFDEYLKVQLAKDKSQRHSLYLGAMRFLAFLDVTPQPSYEEYNLASAEAMVGLYKSGKVGELCNAPLLAPKYTWTRTMLNGATQYVKWHKHKATRAMLDDPQHPCSNYSTVLEQLVSELNAGHMKRCLAAYHESISAKVEEDREALRQMPAVSVLQEAVQHGYMVLIWVADQFGHAAKLPPRVLSIVNACMAGAIAFDTFAGRKGEWESLDWSYVNAHVLQQKNHYVICKRHKTFKTYGELCKRLTPGLFKAFEVYSTYPRPAGCKTFLVPINRSTEKVSLPHALRCFCKLFFPADAFQPWYNLVRKWFHTILMRLTADEQKLKQLMKKLDAHSMNIQEKHYIIRTAEDDTKLADALIEAILVKPVKWPNWQDTAAYMDLIGDITGPDAKLLGEAMPDGAEPGQGIEDEDDMVWWEFGTMFGIQMPDVISNAIEDQSQACDLLPLPGVPMAKLEQPAGDQQQASGSTGAGQMVATADPTVSGHSNASASKSKAFSEEQMDWLALQILHVNGNQMLPMGTHPRAVLIKGIIAEGLAEHMLPSPGSLGIDEVQYEAKVQWVLKSHRPDHINPAPKC